MSDLDPDDVDPPVVHQLRVVVTATDYDEAIHFYCGRDGCRATSPDAVAVAQLAPRGPGGSPVDALL